MNRPLEYEQRVRVRGFAVLDDDFEFMLGDLCCEVEEEPSPGKTRESLAKNRTGCLDPVAWLYVVRVGIVSWFSQKRSDPTANGANNPEDHTL